MRPLLRHLVRSVPLATAQDGLTGRDDEIDRSERLVSGRRIAHEPEEGGR